MVRHVAVNYHLTKFGCNCCTQCGNMNKTVKNISTGGHKLPSSLRVGLNGELIVEYNYKHVIYFNNTSIASNAFMFVY